ncbi:MAG TPA: DUF2933 domain-containing protein [Candidatus Limnocylindria bacterium]|nr:DUF2933 domain-containing protein [Candidatus Limnocylindria bacterium]
MDALLAILPFALLFLLCPLMMLFMHRGHEHDVDEREELLRLRAQSRSTTPPVIDERTSGAAQHQRS